MSSHFRVSEILDIVPALVAMSLYLRANCIVRAESTFGLLERSPFVLCFVFCVWVDGGE